MTKLNINDPNIVYMTNRLAYADLGPKYLSIQAESGSFSYFQIEYNTQTSSQHRSLLAAIILQTTMTILFVPENYDPVKGYNFHVQSELLSHASRISWKKKKLRNTALRASPARKQDDSVNVYFVWPNPYVSNTYCVIG